MLILEQKPGLKTPQISPESFNSYVSLTKVIIGIGVLLRLYHLIYNRSLWEDEIYLSAGIINRSLHQILTGQLPYLQKAPLGYLLVSRLAVHVFGNSEIALRLYPFLCGIASMFMLKMVGEYFLKRAGVVIALSIFALAPPLVYHNVEAKPYGTEFLATLVILYWYIKYWRENRLSDYIIWGLGGAIIVWFAYTSIFILFATAMATALPSLIHKKWKNVILLFIPGIIWLVSFAVNYFLFTKDGSESGWLVDFWSKHDGYLPLSSAAGTWLVHKLFSFFNYPLGLSWVNQWSEHNTIKQLIFRMAFIPLVLTLSGLIYFFRQKRHFLLLLCSVLLIALVASALKLYPMHERLLVYLSPFALILFAGGCELFIEAENKKIALAGYAFALLLLIGPLWNSGVQAIHPYFFGDYKKSYQREALLYLNSNYQPGDMVYVYWNDLPGYTVYKEICDLKYNAIKGNDYRNVSGGFDEYMSKLNQDFKVFEGKKRVWIIHHNHIDIPVGNYVGQPVWYYQQHNGIEKFHAWFVKKGVEKESYKPTEDFAVSDINVTLMDFSSMR